MLEPGTFVGGYVIDELCYQGGFAALYRARSTGAQEIVALKVLHRHLATSEEMLRRFQLEADMLARLAHPNLVELVERGDMTTGQPYLVMEWLEGRSLDAELRSAGPCSTTRAAAIVRQLCGALAVAHGQGIVHRDLKTLNVMVVAGGVVKLVDFGIAKQAGVQLTATGKQLGTPYAMAPEQIRGDKDIDARADIYALGVLLHHLVTGQPPFLAGSALEIED